MRVATCVALALAGAAAAHAGAEPAAPAAPGPPALAPALFFPPFNGARITGGFGESRSNHLHAGLDFSTGGRTGLAVRAPLVGAVERVRASGVGYGRSLYVRVRDGRLLVFGHLDAFAGPLAAWVDSVQCATGEYEQDLWPAPGRFAFATGDTLAWTGESGAGGPHLHVEVRHDDFALDPLRAGFLEDAAWAPRLESVTLEPLDEESFVEGGAAPHTWRRGARAETLTVVGRLRAVVRARSGLPDAAGVPAWSTRATWDGGAIEARFDSLSWAGEMSEQDAVLDRGRVAGTMGLLLWHPPAWTPRVQRVADATWDGVLDVRPGEAPRALRIEARDPNGRAETCTVWLRGAAWEARGPASPPAAGAGTGGAAAWRFAALPGGRLRVSVAGGPRGLRGPRVGWARGRDAAATWDGAAWSAVLAPPGPSGAQACVLAGRLAGTAWADTLRIGVWRAGADTVFAPAAFARVRLPREAAYEPGLVVTRVIACAPPRGSALAALTPACEIAPARTPLRRACTVALAVPPGAARDRADVYRREPDGEWSALRARWDAAGRELVAESATFGAFAVLRDTVPPRVRLLGPARRAAPGPYARWALEARVDERGSGIDARACAVEVDGRRVPAEWDAEGGVLRWRPAGALAGGGHRVRVTAVDRAGNAGRCEGVFVLDSPPR